MKSSLLFVAFSLSMFVACKENKSEYKNSASSNPGIANTRFQFYLDTSLVDPDTAKRLPTLFLLNTLTEELFYSR